jgi:hypothetical protein
MRLPRVPLPHLFCYWPEIAPRMRTVMLRDLDESVGNNPPPTRARFRYRKPAGAASAINRLQEKLS